MRSPSISTLCAALVLIVCATSCAATYPTTSNSGGDPLRSVGTLAWLSGSWASSGSDWRWEEHWTIPAGGTLVGMSRMVQGGRTLFTESIRIEERGGRIVYVVQPSNAAAAEFLLVEHGGWQAVFQNPDHPSPHTIGYRLQPDGTLLGWTVSNNGSVDEKEFFPKSPASLD